MQLTIPVYNEAGEKLEEVKLNVANIDVGTYEVSRAIRKYEFALHQGTKKAKTRGEVVYSKRKPWRQKGTGRARAGTRGSPIWVGGGVAHGPKPYTRRLKLNKQEKRRVFTYMFTRHVLNNDVFLIQLAEDTIKEPSLKAGVAILKNLKLIPFKGYYVTGIEDEASTKLFRNLPKVTVRRAPLLNIFDLYHKRFFLINQRYFDQIKSRLLLEDEI